MGGGGTKVHDVGWRVGCQDMIIPIACTNHLHKLTRSMVPFMLGSKHRSTQDVGQDDCHASQWLSHQSITTTPVSDTGRVAGREFDSGFVEPMTWDDGWAVKT